MKQAHLNGIFCTVTAAFSLFVAGFALGRASYVAAILEFAVGAGIGVFGIMCFKHVLKKATTQLPAAPKNS